MSQLVGFNGPVAPIFRDPIQDAARKLGVTPKNLFRKVAEQKGFGNSLEVADYRFMRWFKYGEIPDWIGKSLQEVALDN